MAEVRPPIETFARIKVVGLGGGGNAAVNRMIQHKMRGVEFVAMNTDAQDLHHCLAPVKIHIGKETTRGLGAGSDPELGYRSAQESIEEMKQALTGADMIFITCGEGGGTGTGAAPVVAQVARELGALTVAFVTKPFSFEGRKRTEVAERGIDELRKNVDTLIVIPNDKVLSVIDRKTPVLEAFSIVDEVLRQGVQGIADLITSHGIINLDFADVKTIMKDAGSALMSIGRAAGDTRAIDATKLAVESKLLDMDISGARGVLFNVTGGSDMTMAEIDEAAKVISDAADADAKIIFGAVIDPTIQGEVKVTIIATGFDQPIDAAQVSEPAVRQLFEPAATEEFFKTETEKTDDELEELDVPAFIRKKME